MREHLSGGGRREYMDEQHVYRAGATRDVIASVHELLKALSQQHSIEPLKRLFWSELNYERANQSLSRSRWPEATARLLAEDPLLLATGYDHFPIIYSRLAANELRTGDERLVVTQLMKSYLDGLFIFSDQSQSIWHLINVKADDKNAKRRLFRRITIGPEERLRTASERIALLDLASIQPASLPAVLAQHEKAFDVEAVTRKFFDDYRTLFRILQKDLWQQTNDERWAHDYALQLLNRCMFLYFIQRKGWLGNDKDFLATFWQSYQKSEHEKNTFFEQWLQILFFEAFNNQFHGGHKHFPPHIHNILAMAPYLNGGLFSRNKLDASGNQFTISDARLEQIFRFLESYNFTIAEDSPLDQEVAVDPEMIGRVYESLVNVSNELDERGDAGIFYTPRTEIDLMCRLSLVDYLANYVGEQNKALLYNMVFALETEEKAQADEALQAHHLWDELYGPLQQITVVDPACGSGAFLVGMLQVLTDLQERAARYHGGADRESPYERKKRIIGQSLYGVDAMEWAAHIAELRLWLALVIDVDIPPEELHARRDPLLPHLTFKIRYGDSLVQEVGGINFGYKQTAKGVTGMLKRRLETLKEEKRKFYDHDPSCRYKTRDAAMQDELQLFRDILRERKLAVERELQSLRNRPMQTTLLANTATAKEVAESAERQRQIEEKERELQHLDNALNALVSPKQIPFVWDISFVEIFSGTNEGFDIVIGNPPYVRQEHISNPLLPRNEVTGGNKQDYKKLLADTVYHDFPDFFQFKPGVGKVGHPIDAKSDLYIYFYLHGLRLLNTRGSFCFITSNSWLDVGYGADLQEFLLKYCKINLILDNQAKRSFATADVNTIIALFSAPAEKPTEEALHHIARFVMFKVGFEQILTAETFISIEQAQERTTTPEYRVYPIRQRTLLEEGYAQQEAGESEESDQKGARKHLIKEAKAEYSSNKWGGKYLRAPDIYWTILEKGRGKLVRLGDIAQVRFGLKSGANEFFYLDEAKIRQWGIEEDFLQPAIKSPRECRSILIDPAALKSKIFMCHKSKTELKGTAALKYIQWGESQNYHKRPSCARRARWWDLGERRAPVLAFNYLIDSTAKTFYAPDGCYFSDNFQEIHIAHQHVLPLCASLNSIVFQLMVNVAGRANFGDGLLKIQTYEVSDLLCLDPAAISFENARILASTSWDVLSPSIERRSLDSLIFSILNLTQGEQDAVYQAVADMVTMRLKKASSLAGQRGLSPKELQKRMEAADNTLGIWVGLSEKIAEEVEPYHA